MNDVNLTAIAKVVADTLALPPERVLVIDVRQDHFCLDILEKTISMEQITGKQEELLSRLKNIAGLSLCDDTYFDARGIMGLINCDTVEAKEVIAKTQTIRSEVEKNILSRALVYSTGFEVLQQMIEDTNAPYLLQLLERLGYRAEFGGIIEDSKGALKQKILEAIDRGFGLVITTGGVGAEDKDFSVEALTALAPDALTPYIVQFEQGSGRHVKKGVRIGVGKVGMTTIINLPGPHDEVVAAGKMLERYCSCQWVDIVGLANELAKVLREKLKYKMGGYCHGKQHH
jgi:molybdenum cofactor synthesis domain-containing protein